MTSRVLHNNTGAWVGLGLGLALAWSAHGFWLTLACLAYEETRDLVTKELDGWRDGEPRPVLPRPAWLEWYENYFGEWWAYPSFIALLVLLVLVCAVAGALIGNRIRASES